MKLIRNQVYDTKEFLILTQNLKFDWTQSHQIPQSFLDLNSLLTDLDKTKMVIGPS